jgi:hypothetical protein
LAVLPSSLGQLLCALLDVDQSLGALVEGHATAYAALVQTSAPAGRDANLGDVGWVVAVRLKDNAPRRVTTLAGASRGFAERVERGMHVLSRVDKPLPVALAIARGWLVVARDEQSLFEGGPYVVGALAVEGLPASSASVVARVWHGALVGPMTAALSSSWAVAREWLLDQGRSERERHGGRQPDFADPEAIVEVLERAAMERLTPLRGATELRIEAEAGSDDVTVDLRATGDAVASTTGDAVASTVTLGDARPLGRVPAESPMAILVRDDIEGRIASAQEWSAMVAQILGSRLRDVDAREIDAAFEAWAQARGDWMAIGLGSATERAFWVQAPASREEVASRAIRQVLGLSRLPPLRGPLDEWLHRLPAVFGTTGRISTATFPVIAAAGPLPTAGAAWKVEDGDVTIALGAQPLERLTALTSRGAKWADDTRTARVLDDLGGSTNFVAVAQPSRFVGAASASSAPLALAFGRRRGDPWARLDIADEIIAAGVRLAGESFPAHP